MKRIIKETDNIKSCVLLPHPNIDGDALCSCLALREFLLKKGVSAEIISEDATPQNLYFLCGDTPLYDENKEYGQYDLAIAVDCGAQDRLGKRENIFLSAKRRMVIDHHVSNAGFGDLYYVDPYAAATCEIVCGIFEEAGTEIDKKTAEILYAGILTDTGGFKFSNTTPKTMRIAASLMEKGIDSAHIYSEILEIKSMAEKKIEALTIENAEFYHGGKTVVSYVSAEMLELAGANESDTSALSSILRGIKGVEVSAVLKATNDGIKLSMRSRDGVNVADICGKFGGGGHEKAAGATVRNMNKEELVSYLTDEIGKLYGRHN